MKSTIEIKEFCYNKSKNKFERTCFTDYFIIISTNINTSYQKLKYTIARDIRYFEEIASLNPCEENSEYLNQLKELLAFMSS